MVNPEDTKALLDECIQWRQQLRDAREIVHGLQNELVPAVEGKTDQDFLRQVDHYQNQFHISLINLHDIKYEIKHHVAEMEKYPHFGHRVPHLTLEDKFKTLLNDIRKLNEEFYQFVGAARA